MKTAVSCAGIALGLSSAARAFEIRGFADTVYNKSFYEVSADSNTGSFAVGGIDFYVAHDISERVDVLLELVFEAVPDVVVDSERLEVGYSFSNLLCVRMGRFHTPLGYYANAYHHGRSLDSAIFRPTTLEFEDGGGLFPGHSVGLMARGAARWWRYKMFLANAADIRTAEHVMDVPQSGRSPHKSGGFNVEFNPTVESGAGLSAGANRISGKDAGGIVQFDAVQRIIAFHAYWETLPVQFIAEAYRLTNKDVAPQAPKTYATSALVVQGAYAFAERWRPYVRFERFVPGKRDGVLDPYMDALERDRSFDLSTVGLRFDLDAANALKMEFRAKDLDNARTEKEVSTQWAFQF